MGLNNDNKKHIGVYIYIYINRSEGFPLTCIFSWAGWDWDLACSENSSVAAAVAVARLTTLPRLPRPSPDFLDFAPTS